MKGRIIKKRVDMTRHLAFVAEQPFVNDDDEDRRDHRVTLIGGARGYLWFRGGTPAGVGWLHGPVTLRALAHAILREIPEPKPKRRRTKARP